MVQDIKTSIQRQEEDARKHLCSHFTKAGKLLPGRNYPKIFDEKIIGKLTKVKERVVEIEERILEVSKKTSNMFKYTPKVNAKSKKRSQKENRRKAKKRKDSRKDINIQKVREFISNSSNLKVIQSQNLKLEALAMLSLSQVKNLQLMYEDGQRSDEPTHLISDYIENFPRKESYLSETDTDAKDDSDDIDSDNDINDDSDDTDNDDIDIDDNDDVDNNH